MFTIKRSSANPILSPIRDHQFEAAASFNGCPIMVQDKTYLVYRAMSEPRLLKEPQIRISTIARAISKDGKSFDPESRIILVNPDRDFDQYGCEDPKVTKLGSRYFITYTALGNYPFNGDGIRVGLAISKDLKTIQEKHLVTPFNAKGMTIFPEKINGKYAALLTVNTDSPPSDICYAEFDEIEDIWDQDKWKNWKEHLDSHKLSLRRLSDDHLELGSQPVKTDAGWLVIFYFRKGRYILSASMSSWLHPCDCIIALVIGPALMRRIFLFSCTEYFFVTASIGKSENSGETTTSCV
jgi:predicted GH43/DUF377 family glycosyl hydrolase